EHERARSDQGPVPSNVEGLHRYLPKIHTSVRISPRHAPSAAPGPFGVRIIEAASHRITVLMLLPAITAWPPHVPVLVVVGVVSTMLPVNCVSGDVPATCPLTVAIH